MNINKVLLVVTALLWTAAMQAQDKIVYPEITYAGTPRTVTIGGINVSGVDNYEDYVLTGISGLTVGQEIDIPGSQIKSICTSICRCVRACRPSTTSV